MKKKVLSLVVVLMLLMSGFTSFAITKGEARGWYYGNVSSWAKEELIDAVTNGIVMDSALLNDCKKNITRQEFATLAVNLYRAVKKEDPAPAPASTFSDTTDVSVRIAYNLGIINGVGNGKFAPDSSVTREQMGVMMLNAVSALGVDYNRGDGTLAMTDKGSVASWAVRGVDFVYENDFMKGDGIKFNPKSTTSVEQAVAIANRVYKKYAKPVVVITENNNYAKGYTANIESDGVYVTFNNTGNKEAVLKYGEEFNPENDSRMKVFKASSTYVANDYRKIYFMDEDGRIISYDFKTKEYHNYEKDFGFANGYTIVEKGKYKGYYVVREKSTNGDMIAYDTKFKEVGPVYTMDQYSVEGYITEAYKFNFEVDGEKYYRMAKYGGDWDQEKTLRMRPDSSSDGPMALVANIFDKPILYNYSGIYEVTMKFNNENRSNAGIVFNVTRASVGNDQYTGYYVGIDPEKNTVLAGWTNYKWNILKEVQLDFDVKKGKSYDLRVVNAGDMMNIYVDGKNYMAVDNSMLKVNGYVGVRGWKADVDYESFSAKEVPY
ncbi:S-layer homology domain-containing protein [Peptoclostridium litorale DSM 5388]|uniref:SLH domain-containing protein n=1 Tax=Peptoclostridium litorale DSM 5388 TaxID=1121324 RepID=A0A069RHC5_PEPLI|nr:S-layer homology domain-containing protein [Peptoclostridium litorale]KDR96426.1 hypothetical protein CLIT_2c00320 [Peptoclostridium litorale DSM 5388]SIN70729.1 S-layer homology domain-containing protein [Peptoclostridium litorale DSM 5388]